MVFASGPKNRRRRFWGATPQCPGVKAPGWNICVADATGRNVYIELTKDGKSYKEPDWVRVDASGASAEKKEKK